MYSIYSDRLSGVVQSENKCAEFVFSAPKLFCREKHFGAIAQTKQNPRKKQQHCN